MKSIFAALSVILLLYIFTFYVDGEMGVILCSFIFFAPLISMIFAVYARKRISVSLSCDGYVKKDSTVNVQVKIAKTGVFPLAVVEIMPGVSEVFEPVNKTYRITLIGEDEKEFTIPVKAKTGGNGEIRIESVCSCGFLGFMKLKANDIIPPPQSVGVIPEIPQASSSSQLFRAIANIVMTSDNDEENDTAMLYSANTSPGYEHREYILGDPMKRVNWKLSTKKNKLMIRLDEAVASVQPVIVLDLFRRSGQDISAAVVNEEALLKAVFGLLTGLVRQGISCTFLYNNAAGETVSEDVNNPELPEQLLLKVLAVKVTPDKRVAISQANSKVCACVIGTTDCGEGLSSMTDRIESVDNISIIGTSSEQDNPTDIPMWYLDGDNNFKQV
ncbi:MAG: DUF58 domain-containing protein [Ruminococcus sp.]|nr:DUF58 domain-containing protein [Ruminococcus sp.]